jgi:hypothetical protein
MGNSHLPTDLPYYLSIYHAQQLYLEECTNQRLSVGSCTGAVTLYEHGYFSGWTATFFKGDYPFAQFVASGASNDGVSSLRVPAGCEAILYGGGSFHDWSAVFSAGDYNIAALTANGAVNDAASSLKVYDAPTPPPTMPPTIISCQAGSYRTSASSCSPCSPGHYCAPGSVSSAPCPAGSYCPDTATIVTCATGHYCAAGSTSSEPCPIGSHCPDTATIMTCDTTGHYCAEGSVSSKPCPAGSYCPDTASIVLCQAGSFSAAIGQTSSSTCTECPAGRYCPDTTTIVTCGTSIPTDFDGGVFQKPTPKSYKPHHAPKYPPPTTQLDLYDIPIPTSRAPPAMSVQDLYYANPPPPQLHLYNIPITPFFFTVFSSP